MHYPNFNELRENPNALAWFLLAGALALHVTDEAMNNFLDFYNPLVLDLRAELGFFPMPTFTFGVWITGLILGIIFLFATVPLVARGKKLARVLTTIFGVFMISNAAGHFSGAIYFGWLVPGFWSSFVLLPAAVFVVLRGIRGEWRGRVAL